MANFIHITPKLWKAEHSPNYVEWAFICPGCKHLHVFSTGSEARINWDFNGNVESPTFSPSLLCNKDHPASRCHLFLRDGQIQFLNDCFHELAGKTVAMEEI